MEKARGQVLYGLGHCHILEISDNEIQWLTGEEDYTARAGKTFCGFALHDNLEHGLDDLTDTDLAEMLDFANCAVSIVTTRKGALRVMPAEEEAGERRSSCHIRKIPESVDIYKDMLKNVFSAI